MFSKKFMFFGEYHEFFRKESIKQEIYRKIEMVPHMGSSHCFTPTACARWFKGYKKKL